MTILVASADLTVASALPAQIGPHEGVAIDNGDDVGNLRHIEQRGDRAKCSCHCWSTAPGCGISGRLRNDQGGLVFGGEFGVVRRVGKLDPGDPGNRGGLRGNRLTAGAGNEDMDFATDPGAAATAFRVAGLSCALSCSARTRTVIQITFASFFSFSTNWATSATLMPAPRWVAPPP